MRILIVSALGELGGGAESMLYELVKVTRKEHQVEVLFMKDGKLKEGIDELKVKTYLLESPRMSNLLGGIKWMVKYASLLKHNEKPDVILNWMTKAQYFAAIPSYLLHIPVCWWQHGVPAPPNLLDRICTALPAKKIGSSSTKAQLAQKKMTSKKVFCSFPGSDSELHSPRMENRTLIREELGIKEKTILLGNIGRLQSWKRQDVLIETLEILLEKQYNVKLLLVGGNLYNLDNDFENKIFQLIKEKGLENNVITTGNQLDVSPYYDAMDIYVHAATGEPFGIVMVEAMLHSKPLIVSKSPGSVEIVENGVTGMIVEDGSSENMAREIEQMITNENLQLHGENGRNRAIRLFSNKQMGSDIIKELENISKEKENNKVVV
ncbi:glycosyltransferase family 4 protein [Paraliobacillus sediminis]|uniref:glycosyltransferase family 4 protein n=1 Tax=Paraliobacillus sediminis TaxID=1885916 RepID=UPI000E3B7F15|nr:glycosyltransferase family 4 protein [Paraliobacillus sediminis]